MTFTGKLFGALANRPDSPTETTSKEPPAHVDKTSSQEIAEGEDNTAKLPREVFLAYIVRHGLQSLRTTH